MVLGNEMCDQTPHPSQCNTLLGLSSDTLQGGGGGGGSPLISLTPWPLARGWRRQTVTYSLGGDIKSSSG
ncbi:unnamed protein product [Brassica rapa subsp. narinosa]